MRSSAKDIDGMRFLRVEQVLKVMPISRATLYRMIDRGEFPKPCRVGSVSVWPYSDVRAWSERVLRTRDDEEELI